MPEDAPKSKLDQLKRTLKEYIDETYNEAWRWQRIYYTERSALIIFSVLTSAQAIASLTFLTGVQAYFALAVTLIAAFEGWLKPAARYRAFYVGNDEFEKLRLKVNVLDETDGEGIAKALEEFSQINNRLQSVAVPS